jgi:hypothetical protein
MQLRRVRLKFRYVAGALSLLVLLLLLVLVALDAQRPERLAARASRIKVGDSKATVTSILGEPDGTWRKGTGLLDGTWLFPGSTPERWAYGRRLADLADWFDREPPFIIPIRVRLFGPDPDDVGIEFDDDGKVKSVTIP